jgi:hypothetical protein
MPFAHSVAVTFRSPLALLIQGKLAQLFHDFLGSDGLKDAKVASP